ncbi:MAG: hypothetical protein JO122_12610 [Acetobacteraceae bacterium]|nr:hypothetical protein [Acetobacteraceae bacterium]
MDQIERLVEQDEQAVTEKVLQVVYGEPEVLDDILGAGKIKQCSQNGSA